MKLSDIYNALADKENGEDLKSFLKQYLTDKDSEISKFQGQLTTAETRLKNIAASLDTTPDELETATKEVKTLKKELDLKTKEVENITGEKNKINEELAAVKRRELFTDFAAVVGGDRDVILDLLPPDTVVDIIEKEDNGKKRRFGVVGDKKVDFAEYVDNDSKLSKYKAAIFPQEKNPPQTPPKLPAGKGKDSNTSEATQVLTEWKNKYQKPVIESLRERFK